MKVWLTIILGLGLLSFAPARADEEPSTRPTPAPSADVRAMAAAGNELGLKTFLAIKNDEGNTIVSPASLWSAITLLRAVGDERIDNAIDQAVTWPLPAERRYAALADWTAAISQTPAPGQADHDLNLFADKGDPKPRDKVPDKAPDASPDASLAMHQAVWRAKQSSKAGIDEHRLPNGFVELSDLADFTQTEPFAKIANAWVAKASSGKIDSMLNAGEVKENTRVMAANVLHFRARWAGQFGTETDEFSASATTPETFATSTGRAVTVQMMHHDMQIEYDEDASIKWIVLPYYSVGNRQYSMVLILPAKPENKLDDLKLTRESLSALLKSGSFVRSWEFEISDRIAANTERLKKDPALTPEDVERNSDEFLKTLKRDLPGKVVSISLPRFTVRTHDDLTGSIPNLSKNFASVIQSTMVAVDEKGTEAVAATVTSGLFGGGFGGPEASFRADRPFLFLIRENTTGSIIFIGRINDPTK